MPFSISSGSGVIFGATGGVTEAALRKVYAEKTNKALQDIEYLGIRGYEGMKTAEVSLGDSVVRIAVVNGLGNAEELIRRIETGEEHFDFVEVMACPGGCIAGAGQPFSQRQEKLERTAGLYKADKSSVIKRSEENPVVAQLYSDGLLKDRAHELLHVHYKTN